MGAQIYGYTVCLVSIISFLISITAFLNAVISLEDSLHSGFKPAGSPSLASYEIYKMDMLKTTTQKEETVKTWFYTG